MSISQGIKLSADFGAYINTRDGAGTNITSTNISGKQGLDVNVISSMGSVGTNDMAPFIYGTSTFLSTGGVYNPSITALTAGEQGANQLTAFRASHVNLRDSSGNELGNSATGAVFVQESYMQAGSGALSQPSISSTSGVMLAANASRKSFTVWNPNLFVGYCAAGPTASTGSFSFPVPPLTLYEPPRTVYTGVISTIAPVGSSGILNVTEYVN